MSAEEQIPTASDAPIGTDSDTNVVDEKRSAMILKAKELYSRGSRNYLVKNYSTAVDELSQVCELYDELYSTLCDELGMPYLLYAKSLIGLAIEESKVIDVPDEENGDEEEDEDEDDEADEADEGNKEDAEANSKDTSAATHTNGKTNGEKKGSDEKPVVGAEETTDEADSTELADGKSEVSASSEKVELAKEVEEGKAAEDQLVSSSDENSTNVHVDGEKPSTSNGESGDKNDEDEEEDDAGSSLQLAWEVLELAAKIFKRQGLSGLPNLAEVHAELGNIQFENNVLSAAREDYEKALKIYGELDGKYYRAMAEINYKIGLTYLLDGFNKEGAKSLKEACSLLDIEIENVKSKDDLTEKDENNVKDIEETKQEIWAKISEIEEMESQQYAEVRAALDSYIKPISCENADGAGPSTSAAASSSPSAISSSQPTNINHLVKRKKPEDSNSEAEAAESPAKRPAV